jgi:transposase
MPTDNAIIAQLQQQLEAKDQQLGAKERALELAQLKIQVLEEHLRQEPIVKYGKRSETLSDLQLELLDLEPGVSSEEVEAESEREPILPKTPDKAERRPRNRHPVSVRRCRRIWNVSNRSWPARLNSADAASAAKRRL